MTLDLTSILTQQGLTKKETLVFLALLELNEGAPSVIAKRSGLKRPTTYTVLEQLQKKGLVSRFSKKNQNYFRAIPPRHFLESQRRKFQDLEDSIPELISLNKKYESTPQMSIFEGKRGLIQIMEDTLTSSTELLCWANIGIAVHTVLESYYPEYIAKKVKNKVYLKGIFPYEKGALKFKKRGEEELREVHLIPKEKCPFENEINIYDDKVAIISHQDEVGVIIQNQSIADTQRAIFNFAFEYAKQLEKDLLTEEDKAYLASDED